MSVTLPEGLLLRAPTMDDAEAVAALMSTCMLADQGAPVTTEEVRYLWQTAGVSLDLATNAWAVVSADGALVGFSVLLQRAYMHFYTEGYIHPEHRRRGIGTHLLRLVESRARQQMADAPPQGRITIQTSFISTPNNTARQLAEQEGYKLVRQTLEMNIRMEAAPPAANWLEGITTRTFLSDQDFQSLHDAIEEAFQDHWNHIPIPFDEWEQRFKREGFDPTLWFLALDGEEIAGAVLCRYNSDNAWVSWLAVRRPWRRLGLGLALLRHAFGEFYRRGDHEVGLTVDAQNITGAVRLYERAGMHAARQYDLFEKVLRD
jgi:mycothiol synthase